MRDLLKELADLGKMVNEEVNEIRKEIKEINTETESIQRERFSEMWKCFDECTECVKASGIDFSADISTPYKIVNPHGDTYHITVRIDGRKWRDGATLCCRTEKESRRTCIGRIARDFDEIQNGISRNWWDWFGVLSVGELLKWNRNDSEMFKKEFARRFTKRMEEVLKTERSKKDDAKRKLIEM